MKADDSAEFKAAMLKKKAYDHTSREHWEVWEKIETSPEINTCFWWSGLFSQSIKLTLKASTSTRLG
jgi:hypothetical protein